MQTIQIKFPTKEVMQYDCPLHWNVMQILSFSVKNQEKFIAQKDKALRLFYAGNQLDNQMVLRDILKDRKASTVTDIPMFLVVTSNHKLEQPNTTQIYQKYIDNLGLLGNGTAAVTNYHPVLQSLPLIGMEFSAALQDHLKQQQIHNQQQQRQPQEPEQPNDQELYFHLKIIFQLVIFYMLFSQHFKENLYYALIAIMVGYYWIKYQEFKNQQRPIRNQQQQQQQQQQQPPEPQQQQQYQTQTQAQTQTQPQESQPQSQPQESKQSDEPTQTQSDQLKQTVSQPLPEPTESVADSINQFEPTTFQSPQFQPSQFDTQIPLLTTHQDEQQQNPSTINLNPSAEQQAAEFHQYIEEEEKPMNNPNNEVDSEPEFEDEIKRIQQQRQPRKNYLYALFELVYCYFMSLFPFWHVGLYAQQD